MPNVMDVAVETFGQWLKKLVWSRHWGATDLANAMAAVSPDEKPISKSAVSEWMNGNRVPRPLQCIRIANALGIDPMLVLEKAGRLDEPEPSFVRPAAEAPGILLYGGGKGLSQQQKDELARRVAETVENYWTELERGTEKSE